MLCDFRCFFASVYPASSSIGLLKWVTSIRYSNEFLPSPNAQKAVSSKYWKFYRNSIKVSMITRGDGISIKAKVDGTLRKFNSVVAISHGLLASLS